MSQNKEELRNALFLKYFEEKEDTIAVVKLLENAKPVIGIWENLRGLLEKNIEDYDRFSGLDFVRFVSYKEKEYVIIKEHMFCYLLIDLEAKHILTKEEICKNFTEEFFVHTLGEENTESDDWIWYYRFLKCSKKIEPILEYCMDYKEILSIPNHMFCRHNIGQAFTYLSIQLAEKEIQLGFQTPDQFLYEFLHFDLDMNPWGMQDAHERIGIERIKEMLTEAKNIHIPKSCVPEYYLQEELIKLRRIKEIPTR